MNNEENIYYSEDNNSSRQPSIDGNGDNSEFSFRNRKGKIITCAKETIENASRMIRRRVPCSGHLMTPRRLWLNKIPTQCDVVIEFPKDAPQSALHWLLERLRGALILDVQVKEHESTKRTAFYITAPINVLIRAAEEARLPKRLRDDLGGALKEFTTRESHCFAQIKDSDGGSSLFTSQERQWLVAQVLQGLRAGANDLETLDDIAKVEEGQSIVAAWQESGLIVQIFPLHENHALSQLQSSWVRKLFAAQPLDDIAEYFGVKVALYFAWLGHYTSALCVPAILGTILWAVLLGRGQTTQDIGNVLFSLFNVAWASLYLEAWRRYSVEISFRWGTLSTPPELLEPPRPLYKGRLEANLLNGRLEPKEAPAWKRRAFRYFVSFPIIGLCLILVFIVMFLMLQFQDWWDDKLPEFGILSYLTVFPKVLLALLITFMDEAYFKLAVYLNDKENYRLQSKYENHLIGKVALFQFVNSFLSLFYIAFYLRDQEKLKEQLAGLLISRQLIGNIRESIFPYFLEQLKLANLSFTLWGALSPTVEASKAEFSKKNSDAKEGTPVTSTPTSTSRTIGQAEIESSLSKYDGTFADHLEMLVQMGYVVLFSAAFPLAGLCALANNLLEIRSDAFKLAHVHQRGFGQRVANIGTWQNALSLLGLAAVIVNCALIGLSGQVSRLWPGLTSTQTVVLIVALEHTMLAVRSILTWLLPELPSWLAAEIARAEHCRREMQCRGVTPRTTSPSPPSTTSMHHVHDPDIYSSKPMEPSKQIFGRFQVLSSTTPEQQEQESRKNSTHDESMESKSYFAHEGSTESPISEASTLLMRPFTDASPDELHSSGACYKAMVAKNLYIPQFRGPSKNKFDQGELINNSSQPISISNKIPEIPPFKKQTNRNVSKLVISNTSESPPPQPQPHPPPRMEIPPYKPKKSKDWPLATEAEHHLTIGPSGGAEWARRLKTADPTSIHRSTDCIAKELSTSSDSELLKPAPSWNTVAFNNKAEPAGSASVPSVPAASTEEEIKAAELAAKKSRIKQSLVKRARSVAIFSLKLKERRAREAERIAKEEDQMSTPFTSFGGELSVIPIEKLIQMEDVVSKTK